MIKTVWHSLQGRLLLCTAIAALGMLSIIFYYYYDFSRATQEQIHRSFESVSEGIEARVDQGFREFGRIARVTGYSTAVQTYLISDDPVQVIASASKASDALSSAMLMANDCINIYLISDNGRSIFYNNSQTEWIWQTVKQYGFDEDVALREGFFSEVFLIDQDPGRPAVLYFFPVYSILPATFDKSNRILCAVLCDLSSMAMWMLPEYEDSISVLFYQDQPIVMGRPLTAGESLLLEQVRDGRGSAEALGVRYLTNQISLPGQGYRFLFMVPESSISAGAVRTRNFSMGLMVLAMALMVGAIWIVVLSINRSVGCIIADLERNDRAAYSSHVGLTKLRELRGISHAINSMLDRIGQSTLQEQRTQARLYEMEIAQKKAEIIAYRTQINPHFLFNTMECMRSMARRYNAEPIEKLISSMSMIFRYSLYSEMIVTLEDELRHLQNYYNVMDLRYPGRYSLRLQVQEDCRRRPMLSMTLQPLVENSILHAFPARKEGCILLVQAHIRENNTLVVRIADNGIGLDDEEIENLRQVMRTPEAEVCTSSDSIGLQNIFRRLKLSFGNHCHLHFRSKKGFYTAVELHIPPVIQTDYGQRRGAAPTLLL